MVLTRTFAHSTQGFEFFNGLGFRAVLLNGVDLVQSLEVKLKDCSSNLNLVDISSVKLSIYLFGLHL